MAADPSAAVQYYVVNGEPGQSTIPAWLTQRTKNKKGAKRTKAERTLGHVELIQEWKFPEASLKIKTTPDGHHAMATGVYKPQIRVYDLDQLTIKFERHTDQENVDFLILSDDWTKSIHLQADRHIDLHTQGGLHHRTRIPHFGRSLAYHTSSCDALIGTSSSHVYRLNLEQGVYMTPLEMQAGTAGVNAVDVNARHGLWSFGTERGEDGGCVEFWDPRARDRIGILSLPVEKLRPLSALALDGGMDIDRPNLAVTSLSSKLDGLSLAVGTSTGHTLLYDLRSPKPYAMKDQGYGLPVKKVQWIEGGHRVAKEGMVASADAKVIKLLDKEDPTTNFTSLSTPTNLNDFHHLPGSGMLMVANEGVHMTTFYVPQLGPAPKWCSFLDNVTEEMEDHQGGGLNTYQDFKFVERTELSSLGLDHLVGTPTLKPYMHGYFISLKLYDAARLVANPFAYAEHRERQVQDKLAKKTESRIRARRGDDVKIKVNQELADKVRRDEERRRAKGGEVEGEDGAGGSLLQDPRFAKVWTDKDFEVDTGSREFMLKNPVSAPKRGKTAVEEEEEESQDSDEAGELSAYDPRTMHKSKNPLYRPAPKVHPGHKPQLVAIGEPSSSSSSSEIVPLSGRSSTFGQRIKLQASSSASKGKGKATVDPSIVSSKSLGGGEMELSFIPSAASSSSARVGKGDDAVFGDEFDSQDAGRLKAERKREEARDRKRRGIELVGAGMEKGGKDEEDVREEEKHGRAKRRQGGRSASGNTFRKNA